MIAENTEVPRGKGGRGKGEADTGGVDVMASGKGSRA